MMKRKNVLTCSVLSIASILSMSVPAMATEPTKYSEIVVTESSEYEGVVNLTQGQIIDLGDGVTAVVENVSEKVKAVNNARAEDTKSKQTTVDLVCSQGNNYLYTLRAKVHYTYCQNDRWVEINDSEVECIRSASQYNVRVSFLKQEGDGTQVATAKYHVQASYSTNVAVKAYYNGNLTFTKI